MPTETEEKIYFSEVKEGRTDYFVEYRPPISGWRFATLQLVYLKRVELAQVAEAMESEATTWHSRYPVPVMVSAFNEIGDSVRLSGVRSEHSLIAFTDSESGELRFHWRLLSDDEIPSQALDRQFLLKTYFDVGFRTQAQVNADAKSYAKNLRVGRLIVLLWFGVGPVAFLILEFFGPTWLATAVFGIGLYKGLVTIQKLRGKWRKSASELAKEEEERRMRHHHYHCERNPEGFLRLKLENFEREQREEIRREADSLNGSGSIQDLPK